MLTELELINGLISLGHLAKDFFEKKKDGELEEAVKSFQHYQGLTEDGNAGNITQRAFLKRMTCGCGLPDIQTITTAGCKWPMMDVKYYIQATPNGLTSDQARQVYRQAWAAWGAVCGLRPMEVISAASANVIMTTGKGKRAGFDGPMGVLAWSELPDGARPDTQLNQVYDLDETFGLTTANGAILLLAVATHEIGHAIGFRHTPANQAKALMNPIYSANVYQPLAADIKDAVTLYGPSSKVPPAGPTPTGQITINIPSGLGVGSLLVNGKTFAL